MLAVAVALRPVEYEGGAEAPDGSAWELPTGPDDEPEIYRTNPRLLLDPGDFDMVTLWSLYRGGHLPDAGGSLDQASLMLDAFNAMEAAYRALTKDGRA